MDKTTYNNVSKGGRIVRVAVGLALVYSTVFQVGALGLAAVLPLLAIYPITTGVLGWDPIAQLVARKIQKRIRDSEVRRFANQP